MQFFKLLEPQLYVCVQLHQILHDSYDWTLNFSSLRRHHYFSTCEIVPFVDSSINQESKNWSLSFWGRQWGNWSKFNFYPLQ